MHHSSEPHGILDPIFTILGDPWLDSKSWRGWKCVSACRRLYLQIDRYVRSGLCNETSSDDNA